MKISTHTCLDKRDLSSGYQQLLLDEELWKLVRSMHNEYYTAGHTQGNLLPE